MSVIAYGYSCPFIFKRNIQNKETREREYFVKVKSEHVTESLTDIQYPQQHTIKTESELSNNGEDFEINYNSNTPPTKGTKCRKNLTLVEKEMVLRVFDALNKDHPNIPKDEVVTKCCHYTGMGRSTVYKILKEKKVHGCVKPPKPASGRAPMIIDEVVRNFIKQKVLQSHLKTEKLSLSKLLQALEENNLPKIGKTKLWETVKEIKEEVIKNENK